jgi:hypothetical protein
MPAVLERPGFDLRGDEGRILASTWTGRMRGMELHEVPI